MATIEPLFHGQRRDAATPFATARPDSGRPASAGLRPSGTPSCSPPRVEVSKARGEYIPTVGGPGDASVSWVPTG